MTIVKDLLLDFGLASENTKITHVRRPGSVISADVLLLEYPRHLIISDLAHQAPPISTISLVAVLVHSTHSYPTFGLQHFAGVVAVALADL